MDNKTQRVMDIIREHFDPTPSGRELPAGQWDDNAEETAELIVRSLGLQWGQRRPLPDRRQSEAVEAVHVYPIGPHGARPDEGYWMQYARDPETGRIAEAFLDTTNHHDFFQSNLYHDIGTLISIALQYGAPLEVLAASMGHGEENRMGRTVQVQQSPIGTVLQKLVEEDGR